MQKIDSPPKLNYYWYHFKEDCSRLATIIERDIKLGKEIINIYGVPRGGVPIAVRLSSLLDLPLTTRPITQSLIVDDVVDTGKVRRRFAGFPYFASIHYKPWASMKPTYYLYETTFWVIYPWEVEDGA